ncbi:hypothetical protein SAY86_025041 [Trapa natans]|uniref:Uncharacterized protein n=1 Tax=Trapa natans TaxID=22666 RepID=A0AAN7M735_TRANT|nr:hypothetical protein SAY86_025041 [Trapa natans]
MTLLVKYSLGLTKVLFTLQLVLFLLSMVAHPSAGSGSSEIRARAKTGPVLAGRFLFQLGELEEDEEPVAVPKTKQPTISAKSNLPSKNQTKSSTKLKDGIGLSAKNKTKLLKPTYSTKPTKVKLAIIDGDDQLKKPNSTSTPSIIIKLKKLNSTSISKPSNSTKKSSALLTSKKSSSVPKDDESKTQDPKPKQKQNQKQKQPSWVDKEAGDDDLVSEFRDLPARFQQTLLPDIERISTTSKAYLNKANKQITKGFKPYVGNKYAPTIASGVSAAFILIPLLLVSLIFNRIKAYFSLQKLLVFIQIYLSIYFSILCLSSIVTGLEPLRFFYTTSPSTYVCIQVMQTLGYVLYLLMLLMYLVLVFSTDCGLGPKFIGLAQTFVGYAVGLHYYVSVFHRVVLHQPPRTSWKVHGVYAACFLLTCLLTQAERRKKTYLAEEGGEEGKKS